MELTVIEYCKKHNKNIRHVQRVIKDGRGKEAIIGFISVRSVGGVYLIKVKGK